MRGEGKPWTVTCQSSNIYTYRRFRVGSLPNLHIFVGGRTCNLHKEWPQLVSRFEPRTFSPWGDNANHYHKSFNVWKRHIPALRRVKPFAVFCKVKCENNCPSHCVCRVSQNHWKLQTDSDSEQCCCCRVIWTLILYIFILFFSSCLFLPGEDQRASLSGLIPFKPYKTFSNTE